MNHLVAIVGRTGIGKSQLALRLAQTFNWEIVSADSRQVYRHMDIGTAKPSWKELSLVPHHLISIVNPDEDFSLAQYQELAYTAIDDIGRRAKLALLVGGSGLYVWSVLEGWGIPPVPPDLFPSLGEDSLCDNPNFQPCWYCNRIVTGVKEHCSSSLFYHVISSLTPRLLTNFERLLKILWKGLDKV